MRRDAGCEMRDALVPRLSRIPKNTRRITLATFVSTAGTGFSYANDARAPAVYGPIPGSFMTSAGCRGNGHARPREPSFANARKLEAPAEYASRAQLRLTAR